MKHLFTSYYDDKGMYVIYNEETANADSVIEYVVVMLEQFINTLAEESDETIENVIEIVGKDFNDFVSSYYEGNYELLVSKAVDRGFAHEQQELVGVRDENAIGIDLELSNYSDLFLLMSLAVLSCDYSDNAKDIFTYLESMNKSDSVNQTGGVYFPSFLRKKIEEDYSSSIAPSQA